MACRVFGCLLQQLLCRTFQYSEFLFPEGQCHVFLRLEKGLSSDDKRESLILFWILFSLSAFLVADRKFVLSGAAFVLQFNCYDHW